MVWIWLRLFIERWNTTAISFQRSLRRVFSSQVSRSVSSNQMCPWVSPVFSGRRRRRAWIMVDLPEPDSPMMPRLSPASTEKET